MKDIIIFGVNPVKEALLSGTKIREIWIDKGKKLKFKEIVKYCNTNAISILEKTDLEFKKLRELEGNLHQGIIAFVERKKVYYKTSDFFKEHSPNPPYTFIILDSINDPRNLGAIIRTCEHFGVSALVIPSNRSCDINSLVYKASSGALNYLPIIQVNNITRVIDELKKKQDFWVYGLDIGGVRSLSKERFRGNIAFVIGPEDRGIRKLIKSSCDFLLRIDNLGNIDSLNVSVATGVCLYELSKQRLSEK